MASQPPTSSERSYLRKYWLNPLRIRFWIVVIVTLYTIVGFLVLPWVAKSYAVNMVKEDLGRDLHIESIHTNPFTLTLEVNDLALDDIDGQELIGFERLYVDLAWSSISEGTVVIPTVRLENTRVHEEKFKSGDTRFTRLMSEFQRRPLPRNKTAGNIIRPRQTGPTLPIEVKDIDFSLDDFIFTEDSVSSFQVSGRFELGGDFAFDGDVQLLPLLDLAGTLDVDELALVLAEPFVQDFAKISLESGSLSAEGKVASGPDDPLTYAGMARIDSLDIDERKDSNDIMGWQALIIDEIDFRLGKRSLDLSVIQLDQLAARVFIAEDRSTNLGKLMVEQPASPEPAPEEETEPFDIGIGGVSLESGALDFTDRSLPLPFAAHVKKLSGSVSRLSPGQDEPTRIDLEGQVGNYGQAEISGELNPWNPFSRTRIDLVFENMDIPNLTPYAVTFTGRRISEGRMDVDLGYKMDEGLLKATNHIVLRDLKLGESIESPNATNLPLRLAISLLKNSEGVISVDIPVKGNVNDPKFSFGPAIRQALTNILKSIISAPFNMLAGLVEGDTDSDELAKVAFDPGTSEIGPPQQKGLDQLRKALNKRPELAVKLPAAYAPDADRLALQRQKAQEAMTKRLKEAGMDIANPSLKAAETSETLKAMFSDQYPKRDLDDVRERFNEKSEVNTKAYRKHLATEVAVAQTVKDKELEALAQARTKAVRNFILSEGEGPAIEPDRVQSVAPIEVEADEDVILEIGLAAD